MKVELANLVRYTDYPIIDTRTRWTSSKLASIEGTDPGGVPMKKQGWILFVAGFVACLAIIAGWSLLTDGSEAEAKASPVKALEDREVYYPGTEDLAPDEMRVTACGTGMPSVRPKQAATC
jgi:hypothetical protein